MPRAPDRFLTAPDRPGRAYPRAVAARSRGSVWSDGRSTLAPSVFVLTIVMGVSVVAAIGLAPLYVGRLRVSRSVPAGVVLVAGAVALASISIASDQTFGQDELFVAL